MPCAVNETTAVIATASSKRHQPDAAPDIIAEEPEGTRRTTVGEQGRCPGRPFRSPSYWRARIAHRELALVGALSARKIDCESAATHESLVGTSRHRRWYARFLPLPTSTSSQPPRKRDQG
jgi:hypothetical protein